LPIINTSVNLYLNLEETNDWYLTNILFVSISKT